MEETQLREEMIRYDVLEPVVYDYGKTGHICPECEALLTTVPCTTSCPYSLTCEDFQQHFAGGVAWCPVEKEIRNDDRPWTELVK